MTRADVNLASEKATVDSGGREVKLEELVDAVEDACLQGGDREGRP